MPRRLRVSKRRPPELDLDPVITRHLLGLANDTEQRDDRVVGIEFFGEPASPRQLWLQHERRLIATWTLERPGTRPELWWLFFASESRQRLGGTGTPYPAYIGAAFGIPLGWNPGTIDPRDPPRFEGQGAYLRRLGLLLPGEKPPSMTLEPELVGASNA